MIVKLIFFPLANKSLRVDDEDEDAAAGDGEDARALQGRPGQAAAGVDGALQAEKINPAAGCLPIVLQIPVFFSLYKVLFVTIEMRQAPFFGWIRDLSAPDPTSIFNLFGLLPWAGRARTFLHDRRRGRILMGITMWLQMQLNPRRPTRPADDLQLDAGDLHLHAGHFPPAW